MSKKITVSKAIGEALHEEMLRDEKVFIMGEDMAVMGNVFAITKGFLEEFGPNRVIDTPISEEGFVGMAVGAAVRGMRPVVELMYDDFATECADPLFNQAAKIRYMTGGQCNVPMVLRAPMGSGRRNAGQHSQSLENFFCHFPGLKVVAPCSAEDAKGLLKTAIRDDDPVVFLEHKLLYVQTPSKYPMSIFVKLSMDADSGFNWNRILALSLISIIPQLIVFFCAQDAFIDGISAGAVKG